MQTRKHPESRVYAAFSGDLIGSRRKGAAATDASMTVLADTAGRFGQLYESDLRFTRSRGDSWQVLLDRPGLSLEACIAFAAALRAARTGLETRIAIGIGPIESPGTSDLSDAAGPAFETAGDLLSRMGGNMPERWTIDGAGVSKWPQAVLALAEWVARGWTAPQAEAVALVLLEGGLDTNEARATRLGITRQAFEARLKGAGFDALSIPRSAFQSGDFGDARP